MAVPITDSTRSTASTPAAPATPAPVETAQAAPAPEAPAVTAAPATPLPVPEKTHTTTNDLPPEALTKRLESERKALLSRLGFESEEEAKKIGEEIKTKREAEKTAETKAAEAKTAREAAERRAQDIESRAKVWADAELSKLTPEQKAAVEVLAGNDPVRVFDTINALRPTWAAAVTAAVAPTVTASTAAPAPNPQPPATTAPPPAAPAPGTGGATDVKALANEAWKTNPFRFAQIVESNPAAFSTKTYQ